MTKASAMKKANLTEDKLTYRRIQIEDGDETLCYGILCWWFQNREQGCTEMGFLHRDRKTFTNAKVYGDNRDYVDVATWSI